MWCLVVLVVGFEKGSKPAAHQPVPADGARYPSGTCLHDGVPLAQRRNYTIMDMVTGEFQYNGPVRMFTLLWSSARVANTIGKVILEEVLGYYVDDSIKSWDNKDQIQSLSGCIKGADCNAESNILKPRAHVSFESWKGNGQQGIPKNNLPEVVQNLNYKGEEGVYFRASIGAAYYAKGRILNNYLGWNAEVYDDLTDSFLTFREMLAMGAIMPVKGKANRTVKAALNDIGDLTRVTHQYDPAVKGFSLGGAKTTYDAFTGDSSDDPSCLNLDTDPPVLKKLQPKTKCGQAWVAKSSRADPLGCVAMISSSDWGYFLVPQAAKYKWPVCYMTFGWSDYVFSGGAFNALIYWWTPDVTFKLHGLEQLFVPKYNGLAEANGDLTTNRESTLQVLAWKYIRTGDKGRGKFIAQFQFNVAWYDADASTWMTNRANGMPDDNAACKWLRDERDRWEKWIPQMEPPCPLGQQFDVASDKCQMCRPGHYASEENRKNIIWNCLECSTGHAQPKNSSSSCDQCVAGHYAGETGQTACKRCQKGFFQRAVAQSACSPCSPGAYTDKEAQGSCILCPQGQFQDSLGKSECKTCKETFTTEWTGTEQEKLCTCAKGKYWNRKIDSCVDCQNGGVCEGGFATPTVWEDHHGRFEGGVTDEQVAAKNGGTYPKTGIPKAFDKLTIFTCRPGQCDPQPGKPDKCMNNREGIACAICAPGHYQQECIKCGEGGGAFVVLIILLISCPFLIWAGCVATSKPYAAKASAAFQMVSTFGIMATFVQMVGMMGSFNITWNLQGIFDFGALFLLDLDAFGLGCLVGNSFEAQFYSTFLLPVLIAGCLWIMLPVSHMVPSIMGVDTKLNRDGCLNFMGMVYSALYISLVKLVVADLECMPNPDGPATLNKYKQVVCWSAEHNKAMAGLVLGMIFYVVGFFVLCGYLNVTAPARFHSLVFRARCKFLVNRWRVDRWYWGSVCMARNLALALIAVISSTAVDQFIMMAVVMVIFIMAGCAYMPWKDQRLAQFDNCVCFIVLLAICCGIGFMHLASERKQYARDESDTGKKMLAEIDGRVGVFKILLGVAFGAVLVVFLLLLVFVGHNMRNKNKLDKVEQAKHAMICTLFEEIGGHDNFQAELKRYVHSGTHVDIKYLHSFLGNMEARIGLDPNRDGSSNSMTSQTRLQVDVLPPSGSAVYVAKQVECAV